MIWHIIKKDWKLSWLMIIGVAALQWIWAAIELRKNRLFLDFSWPQLRALNSTILLYPIALMASGLLIAVIVQQEAIPGVRQDWLTRPIQRWHLLLEKILFVVAAVQGPILAADIFLGLANGFPLRQTLAAAISRAVFLLPSFTLPVLALASLTRNILEAIISALIALLVCLFLALATLGGGMDNFRLLIQPTWWSGEAWIVGAIKFALVPLGVGTILGVQYFRRKTVLSRYLIVVFLLLMLSTSFLPWKTAFAMQQRLSSRPGSGVTTVLDFNPGAGRFHSPGGTSFKDNKDKMTVHVPLRVAGLPADSVLLDDRFDVCLIGTGGKTEYCGTGDTYKEFRIRKEGPDAGSEAQIYQEIDVPSAVYGRIKDQPLRLEINYSLTQWRLDKSYALPAVGGDQRMPGLGRCTTHVSKPVDPTYATLTCMQPGKGEPYGTECRSAFLENATTGQRNPTRFACYDPDYTPYFVGSYSVMTDFIENLDLRDPSDSWSAHFPVDRSQLSQSRVVVRLYQPTDHFTRQVVIPRITLKEWEAQ